MGRTAKYRNAAEKQQAYRERAKRNSEDLEAALIILDDLKEQSNALRNRYSGKDARIEHHIGILFSHASIFEDNKYRNRIDWVLFQFMCRTGLIEKVSGGRYFEWYRFKEAAQEV